MNVVSIIPVTLHNDNGGKANRGLCTSSEICYPTARPHNFFHFLFNLNPSGVDDSIGNRGYYGEKVNQRMHIAMYILSPKLVLKIPVSLLPEAVAMYPATPAIQLIILHIDNDD